MVEAGVDGDMTSDVSDAGMTVFDTTLQYFDQVLPEAQAMAEGGPGAGGEAGGSQWPVCPPDIPATLGFVDDAGNTTLVTGAPSSFSRALAEGGVVIAVYDAGINTNWEVPAVFASNGESPAPDGSPCASQPYLGSAACDFCAKAQQIGVLYSPYANGTAAQNPSLPPCSDLWDAGVAAAGPGAGQPLHELCMNLFDCVVRTGCMANPTADFTPCFCSLPTSSECFPEAGPGPCMAEMKAAMQISSTEPPMMQYTDISKHQQDVTTLIYHPAGEIGALFVALRLDCAQACPILGVSDGGAEGGHDG